MAAPRKSISLEISKVIIDSISLASEDACCLCTLQTLVVSFNLVIALWISGWYPCVSVWGLFRSSIFVFFLILLRRMQFLLCYWTNGFLCWVWVKEILQSIFVLKKQSSAKGDCYNEFKSLVTFTFSCYIKVSKLLVFFETSKLNLTPVMVNLSHYRKTLNQAHALCFAIVTLFNLLKSTLYHINSYSFYCIILKALFTLELKFRFENKRVRLFLFTLLYLD
jgi:hypothetical protein